MKPNPIAQETSPPKLALPIIHRSPLAKTVPVVSLARLRVA
jgi:hypothetical protein